MKKNIIISIIFSAVLIVGTFYFASSRTDNVNLKNVEIRDNVQYVTVLAKGGYSPRVTQIKSDIPTRLIVKTENTYDCSISLVIRSVGFQKILQPTGEETIDLGTLKAGDKVYGVCGMGMYNFQIKAD